MCLRSHTLTSCPRGTVTLPTHTKCFRGPLQAGPDHFSKTHRLEATPGIWASGSQREQLPREILKLGVFHHTKVFIWLLLKAWPLQKLHLRESILADESPEVNKIAWFCVYPVKGGSKEWPKWDESQVVCAMWLNTLFCGWSYLVLLLFLCFKPKGQREAILFFFVISSPISAQGPHQLYLSLLNKIEHAQLFLSFRHA